MTVCRHRVLVVLVALAACLAPGASLAGWRWQLDPASTAALDADDQAAATRLLETASAMLPPAWRHADGLDVRVQWRDDLGPGVHGHARGTRIRLRRDLLAPWTPGTSQPGPDDPGLRAVLHEFAHRYDRSPHGGLSRDPRLRDLAGWPVRPLRFGRRVRDNAMRDRSPDAYERTSPAEFVAVNLEHFLLDPQYACRRPALHAHFAAHFGWSPVAETCSPALPLVDAEPDGTASPLRLLDPGRVYAVEYLLAEANARPMSRWGHSMLRLVVCAPGRPPGPACRFDLDHHRVLSFRAFVDDVQISSLRGLTGRYPSRLFVLPLDQVVEEYTRVELRGLQSIPLRLSQAEIASLLERAATLHWSYDGRYYFLSNNCAVETWQLLQTGVPRLSGPALRSITPTGLLRKLVRAGVADPDVIAGEDAVRTGHHFPAADAEFQALFEIAAAGRALPVARVDAWLALSPQARAPHLEGVGSREGAALLVLEHAARRAHELALRDALKRRLLDRRDRASSRTSERALVREALAAGDGLSRPAHWLEGGYGLPQADELAAAHAGADLHGRRLLGLRGQLDTAFRAALTPAERARTEALEHNIAQLGARLRELHREAEGLRLD